MTDYKLMIKQAEELAQISRDAVAVMANVSAILFHSMENINWAGFYLVKDGALLLGPFQGRVACVRIEKGKGVCGTAWAENRMQVVDDVHSFPGHIACDSASRSEIVIPVRSGGRIIGVLDIDSPVPARFSEADQEGLERIVQILEAHLTVPEA